MSALIAADPLTKLFTEAEDHVIVAVVSVTLLLTVALSLFDRRYELFKHAVAIRAKILETQLNLELTETIYYRANVDKFEGYVFWIYVAFAAAAGVVGILVLFPNLYLFGLFSLLTVIAAIVLYKISTLDPNFTNLVDWSLNRLQCEQGEKVRITATNLCPDLPASYEANQTLWEIRKEGETKPVVSMKTPVKIVIPEQNNYSWEWSTDKLEPGIYRVFPSGPKGAKDEGLWVRPLKRAIVISKPN